MLSQTKIYSVTLLSAALLVSGCVDDQPANETPELNGQTFVMQGCDLSSDLGKAQCAIKARDICEKNGYRRGALLSLPENFSTTEPVDVPTFCNK